jgi:hypothetical protein
MHYADSNIRTDTLLEAYCKPLFMGYQGKSALQQEHAAPLPGAG